jgi:DNA (cytosine-5)-methyltransferase 1
MELEQATLFDVGEQPAADEPQRPVAAEFFAGIGLVRIGLEQAGFRVAWSNDIDKDKRDMYTKHFGESDGTSHELNPNDIAQVTATDIPKISLAWASFPCTDLSLAGNRDGLAGKHSGTFWHFIDIMKNMGEKKPPMIALENVSGFATSRSGEDLRAAITALNNLGYYVDVLVIDAVRFVPQSRPRMFLVCLQNPPEDESDEPHPLRPSWLDPLYKDDDLLTHRAKLPQPPEMRTTGLEEIVDKTVPLNDPSWWDERRTSAFLESLTEVQKLRLATIKKSRKLTYRTAYRRTRDGIPRWEIRNDSIAGCLRTARGGSSKQALVRIQGSKVMIRWMTSKEYAALMGAPGYNIDNLRTNQALFGFGDAVVVDVVEWLGENYLMPLAMRQASLADADKEPTVAR